MPADAIARMRVLLTASTPDSPPPWKAEVLSSQWSTLLDANGHEIATEAVWAPDAAAIVALRNHADALLDLAEAAKRYRSAVDECWVEYNYVKERRDEARAWAKRWKLAASQYRKSFNQAFDRYQDLGRAWDEDCSRLERERDDARTDAMTLRSELAMARQRHTAAMDELQVKNARLTAALECALHSLIWIRAADPAKHARYPSMADFAFPVEHDPNGINGAIEKGFAALPPPIVVLPAPEPRQ